ncbi:VOC family protein [Modestobacter sp. SYSU DS0657]
MTGADRRLPEATTVENRLHLDLRADGATTAAEQDRLLALGACRVDVGQPDDDASWTVLADPKGNDGRTPLPPAPRRLGTGPCRGTSRTVQEAEE